MGEDDLYLDEGGNFIYGTQDLIEQSNQQDENQDDGYYAGDRLITSGIVIDSHKEPVYIDERFKFDDEQA